MENEIKLFFNCGKCLKEMPDGESPRSYGRIICGWTVKGFQVWCARHDVNIINLDFNGKKMAIVPAVDPSRN